MTFAYGDRQHAVSVLIDHGRGGGIRDTWVTKGAGLRADAEREAAGDPLVVFEVIDAPAARLTPGARDPRRRASVPSSPIRSTTWSRTAPCCAPASTCSPPRTDFGAPGLVTERALPAVGVAAGQPRPSATGRRVPRPGRPADHPGDRARLDHPRADLRRSSAGCRPGRGLGHDVPAGPVHGPGLMAELGEKERAPGAARRGGHARPTTSTASGRTGLLAVVFSTARPARATSAPGPLGRRLRRHRAGRHRTRRRPLRPPGGPGEHRVPLRAAGGTGTLAPRGARLGAAARPGLSACWGADETATRLCDADLTRPPAPGRQRDVRVTAPGASCATCRASRWPARPAP